MYILYLEKDGHLRDGHSNWSKRPPHDVLVPSHVQHDDQPERANHRISELDYASTCFCFVSQPGGFLHHDEAWSMACRLTCSGSRLSSALTVQARHVIILDSAPGKGLSPKGASPFPFRGVPWLIGRGGSVPQDEKTKWL